MAPTLTGIETGWIIAEQSAELAGSPQCDSSGQADLGATIEQRFSHGCFPAERRLVKRCESSLVEGLHIGTETQQCDQGLRPLLHYRQVQRVAPLVDQIHSSFQVRG